MECGGIDVQHERLSVARVLTSRCARGTDQTEQNKEHTRVRILNAEGKKPRRQNPSFNGYKMLVKASRVILHGGLQAFQECKLTYPTHILPISTANISNSRLFFNG